MAYRSILLFLLKQNIVHIDQSIQSRLSESIKHLTISILVYCHYNIVLFKKIRAPKICNPTSYCHLRECKGVFQANFTDWSCLISYNSLHHWKTHQLHNVHIFAFPNTILYRFPRFFCELLYQTFFVWMHFELCGEFFVNCS